MAVTFVAGFVLAEAASSPRSVSVTWDASPDADVTDYVVRYGVRSKVYSKSLRTGGRTTAMLGGFQEGIGYYITVAAVNRLGLESDPAEEMQFADPCAARLLKLKLSPISGPTGGARVSFDAAAGRKYQVESSIDLQSWTPEWITPVAAAKSTLEFTDARPTQGRWRYYRAAMAGPFVEASTSLTLTPIPQSAPALKIGFNTDAGRAYELQASDNGRTWTAIWSRMTSGADGWVEYVDGSATSSRRYRLMAAIAGPASLGAPCTDAFDAAPIVSDPPAQFTWMDVPTEAVALLISDPDTPLPQLQLSATSSDPAIVPSSNIRFTGRDGQRAAIITPARGRAGRVVIDIVVSDGSRIAATAFEVEVLPFTPSVSPIRVRKTAGGSISPAFDGQELRTGQRYTVKATPEPGYTFAGWSGDVSSKSSTITFTMRPRLELEAIFVANPFAAIQGTYAGLFREDDALRPGRAGLCNFSVTDRGKYSGKVLLGGKSHSFSGQLDAERNATNSIPRKGTNVLVVQLSFGGGDSDQVSGRVTDGVWQAPLLGYRNSFHAKASPAPFAGPYTMIVQGQDDPNPGPEGHGYGVVKVDGYGRALFAGTLADGSKVSQKIVLSNHGQWPFHGALYGGQGMVQGWVTLTNRTANAIRGTLGWIKPALPKTRLYPSGFIAEATTLGSPYTRPATATNRVLNLTQAEVIFSGGNLPTAFTNTVTLSERNKVGNLGSNKLSLSISTSTGRFRGSVINPASSKSASFQGVVLQNRNGGAGFLAGTNRSARVRFGF